MKHHYTARGYVHGLRALRQNSFSATKKHKKLK